MKTIKFLPLLFAIYVNAQAPFSNFFEFAIDPKMAVQGLYKGKVNDTNGGTFNAEFRAGFEWKNYVLGLTYEIHQAIEYQKWAVFFDKKFNNRLLIFRANKFTTRAGLEAGMIIRTNPVDDHRPSTKDWIQLGANGSIYYNIWPQFSIGANFNVFRAEQALREQAKTFADEFRTDVMISLKFNTR